MKISQVRFSLWNDGTKAGQRDACIPVMLEMCDSKNEADVRATQLMHTGKPRQRDTAFPRSSATEYYVMAGKFPPTMFVYTSEGTTWQFCYLVDRWSLTADYTHFTGGSSIRGKLNCNLYSVYEVDSKAPLDTKWLIKEIEWET